VDEIEPVPLQSSSGAQGAELGPAPLGAKNGEARAHEKLNAVYESAMNAIAHAFLIVDRGRSIVFHNKAAKEWLARRPGLRIAGGRLRGHCVSTESALENLVVAATAGKQGTRKGGALALPHPDGFDWQVFIVPLRTHHDGGDACAMVVIGDQNRKAGVTIAQLREVFALTSAEARLAVALCNGKFVTAFALEAKVSVHTVRAQLSATLHKTGTHRQADMVRLLNAAPRLIDKA
jgi:DNA-binding CsgD family transcriptional regulator